MLTQSKIAAFLVCVVFLIAPAHAQKPSQNQWPDNIIITEKRDKSKVVDLSAVEQAGVEICGRLGKSFSYGDVTEFWEMEQMTQRTTYLAGRRKAVITKGFTGVDEKGKCLLAVRPYIKHEYHGVDGYWVATQVEGRPVHFNRPQRVGNIAQFQKMKDAQYQIRAQHFQGKWRHQRHESTEVRFGHRCGYPPDPTTLVDLKSVPAEFRDSVGAMLAAAKQEHDQPTLKLCTLVGSPEHVGTGHLLVLHKVSALESYNEANACFENDGASFWKKDCSLTTVTGFQVNAAMPSGVFEVPDWARGAASQASGGKS